MRLRTGRKTRPVVLVACVVFVLFGRACGFAKYRSQYAPAIFTYSSVCLSPPNKISGHLMQFQAEPDWHSERKPFPH